MHCDFCPSQFGDYIDILAAYDPDNAKEIGERHRHGIDVVDELYENLTMYDEIAAEHFLDHAHEMGVNR